MGLRESAHLAPLAALTIPMAVARGRAALGRSSHPHGAFVPGTHRTYARPRTTGCLPHPTPDCCPRPPSAILRTAPTLTGREPSAAVVTFAPRRGVSAPAARQSRAVNAGRSPLRVPGTGVSALLRFTFDSFAQAVPERHPVLPLRTYTSPGVSPVSEGRMGVIPAADVMHPICVPGLSSSNPLCDAGADAGTWLGRCENQHC